MESSPPTANIPDFANLQELVQERMSPPEQPQDAQIDRIRYLRVTGFFARVILHIIFFDLIIGRIWIVGRWVRNSRSDRFRKLSRRFRLISVKMGGVMIKLGQFLSARVDVLPPEIIGELIGLQDEVAPVELAKIQAMLTQELGDINVHFSCFEDEPLAAASLGQTHRAWLRSMSDPGEGIPVVVKVQRPDIQSIVQTDLAALRVVARWVMRYRPIRQRANVPNLMEEFGITLWEELDYKLERANAQEFAELFTDYEGVYIPSFHDELCTSRILVIENVEGLKLTDLDGIAAAGIDPKAIADRLLDVYFMQVFEASYFHADPHPGNLFLRAKPERGQTGDGVAFDLIFIDFGMMGRIPAKTSELLRQVVVSVTTRNAKGLTQAYDDLGFFLPGADLDRISEAQEAVLERVWGRDLLQLAKPDIEEVAELGNEFRDLLFDFPFQIPQNFIYLGRALGILSGLSAMLNPDINPWFYIEQYGQRLIGASGVRQAGVDAILDTLREYATIPSKLKRSLDDLQAGKLKIQFKPDRRTEQQLERLEKRTRQTNSTIASAALLVSGTVLYISDFSTEGMVFWGISAALWLLSSIRS